MTRNSNALAALMAALISVFSSTQLDAGPILVPVDLSANVIESVVPGGTVGKSLENVWPLM